MLKNILHTVIFLLLICMNSYILANELKKQELYINVLDTNGEFENNLFFNYTNSINEKSPVAIEQIRGDGFSSALYKITRDYLPTNDNEFVDMDGPEEYLLRIFKNTNIERQDIITSISATPVYSTWFTNYLLITIKNKFIQKDKKEGMLPFLNTNNLTLLAKPTANAKTTLSEDELKHQTSVAMNHLFEMAGAVARQLELQKDISHKNILAITTTKNIPLMNIPDDTFINYMYNMLENYNIINLVYFMHDIANTLAYLHKNGIIHGDIKLSNLFVIGGKIVLSGFERFSVSNSEHKDLGLKKFTFYNNIYHAPEIRFPINKNRKWDYTTATYKGNIYSLGMLFAGILYICLPSSEYNFELFQKVKEQLPVYIKDEHLHSVLFNRHPDGIKQYIKNIFYNDILADIYFYKNKISSCFVYEKEENQLNIFLGLVTMINQCHQENPERRPTADKIADELLDIIQKYKD